MKVLEIMEAVDQYSFFQKQRQKKRQDEKQVFKQQCVEAYQWYMKNIKPMVTHYINQPVFGFKNVAGLHDYLNQTLFGGNGGDEIIDTESYDRFHYEISRQDEQTTRRLKTLAQQLRPLIKSGIQIEDKLNEWYHVIKPVRGSSFYGLYLYSLPRHERDTLDIVTQTVNWIKHLQHYFSIG